MWIAILAPNSSQAAGPAIAALAASPAAAVTAKPSAPGASQAGAAPCRRQRHAAQIPSPAAWMAGKT